MTRLFTSGSLELTTDQHYYFLRPDNRVYNGLPSEETILSGFLHINLPKARPLNAITVTFKTIFKVSSSNVRVKSHTLFERKLELEAGGKMFPKGKTSYTFAFALPSSLAPTDQTSQGVVSSFLQAHVGSCSMTTADLHTTLPVELISDGSRPGSPTQSFDVRVESHSHDIGPFCVEVVSNSLTVAGFVNVRVRLLDPPEAARITDIRATIQQTSLINDGHDFLTCSPDYLPLFQLGSHGSKSVVSPTSAPFIAPWPVEPFSFSNESCLAQIEAGQQTQFQCMARLPNDVSLRPSTSKHTQTALQISHKLIITVSYSLKSTFRTITISKGLDIASCACSFVSLPPYEVKDPLAKNLVLKPAKTPCQCQLSLAEALVDVTSIRDAWQEQANNDGCSLTKAWNDVGPTNFLLDSG